MLITLEKEIEIPCIFGGKEVYINVYTDYDVSIDKDIETGASFYEYKEKRITYELTNILEEGTENEIEEDVVGLSKEDKERLQAFAESHSSHSDYEIIEEYRSKNGI